MITLNWQAMKTSKSLQSIKVAASQTLKTRIVKSLKQYKRLPKHKATTFSEETWSLFFV
jgi:hypothetical protein